MLALGCNPTCQVSVGGFPNASNFCSPKVSVFFLRKKFARGIMLPFCRLVLTQCVAFGIGQT